jgi:hypothetical protein
MVIVDLMELFCSGDVSSRHVLLQEEKVNLWADSHSAAAFHAAKRMNQSSKNIKLRANSTVSGVLAVGGVGSAVLSGAAEARAGKDGQRGVMTVMEETRGSELQALVVIPKVTTNIKYICRDARSTLSTSCLTISNPVRFLAVKRRLSLKQETEKSIFLNWLYVSKPLVVSISQKSENLRLYNLL